MKNKTKKIFTRVKFHKFRCGTHSAAQGYTIEQDLSKKFPDCCAKLVKTEKKAKRIDVMDSSAVKIREFRNNRKSIEVPSEKKAEAKPVDEITAEEQPKSLPKVQPKSLPREQPKSAPKEQPKPVSKEQPAESSE